MSGALCSTTFAEAPPPSDAWKRAVHRPAPHNFHVELLPPEKHGNSHSYGFRVYKIKDDDASTAAYTTFSGESMFPTNEYDIWRKWDDCLGFQDGLEAAYSRAAREKRSRLAAGKGIKKNGVYVHSDQAASWESLPFGPDPNDIAYDIHQCIPKLSNKGALFRPSQDMIARRYHDLQMMTAALLQDDLPVLIREIKNTPTFTDFFGVWRRDIDLAKARSPQKLAADRPRSSLSSSIFSAFPISSISHSAKSSPSKGKIPERTPVFPPVFTHSDSSSDGVVDLPRRSRSTDRRQEIRSMRDRASSSGSHSSSSSPSTPVTVPQQLPPTSRQPVIASQEVPARFGHNPHAMGDERSSFVLESLPEDGELASSQKSDPDEAWSARRAGSARKANRKASIYVPPSSDFPGSSELFSQSPSRLSRASLQSIRSSATLRAATYLNELGVDYYLPSPTPEPRHHPRASVSSLASLVTNSSVDAVIPRSERPSRLPTGNTRRSRRRGPWSKDDSHSEDQGDILDDYLQDMIVLYPKTPSDLPETPTVDESIYHFSQEQSNATLSSFSGYSDRRSSWTTSISSGSTASSGNPTMISIKAMHEDNIVMLRLPRSVTFDELRRKIYDKFIQTDKSTICETFAIALVEQTPAEMIEGGRPCASSVSSLGSTSTNGGALRFIPSQDVWDRVAANHCGKMFLRIIGSRE